VRELRGIGISPDAIVCRTNTSAPMPIELKEKIALFCDVPPSAVVQNGDAKTIYQVPLNLEAEGLAQAAIRKLNLPTSAPHLDDWSGIVERVLRPERIVTIALVGKYVELKDAYISIIEALHHSGIFHSASVEIKRIDSETVENDGVGVLAGAHGILVAPGFGARGVKGKLRAIQHARENKIPFLGICYGMQLACIEFARNVCELPDAMTSEVDETAGDPVIDFMPDQRNLEMYGGTMRLGTYACTLEEGSQAAQAYGELEISERHRHRYEFNNRYRPIFEEHGMRFTGHHTIGKTRLVEVIELPVDMHPWFVGTQAHPEFKSRPNRPSPLYRDFIGAALAHGTPAHAGVTSERAWTPQT
jgi:CTP synthase